MLGSTVAGAGGGKFLIKDPVNRKGDSESWFIHVIPL